MTVNYYILLENHNTDSDCYLYAKSDPYDDDCGPDKKLAKQYKTVGQAQKVASKYMGAKVIPGESFNG